MKISASIYSDKKRPLKEVIDDLIEHQVDMLHVDCNDDLSVFEDIKQIRTWCSLPIDLHIITDRPEVYFEYLESNPVEYVTFQYETLITTLDLPINISGKKGLAITTETEIEVFEKYQNFDFLLIMATTPGQSGGTFDSYNFAKIRKFRKYFPGKSIHVDGGVNGEVSFILRNMGVSTSVSGSYLFNAPSIGHALMNLTKRDIASHFVVRDFMIPLEECPSVTWGDASLKQVLESIELGNLGFCLCLGGNNELIGIVSSADVRKALLMNLENITNLSTDHLINLNPLRTFENHTVSELLITIKKSKFPVMYLPVVDVNNKAVGIVNFVHLIRGEL
jgi:pentose-5-phosphate-3-epimerase